MAFYKRFVRGSEHTLETTSSATVNSSKATRGKSHKAPSGKDTQSFYEELVGLSTPVNTDSEPNSDTQTIETQKGKRGSIQRPDKISPANDVWPQRFGSGQERKTKEQLKWLSNDFLRHAQEGDLDALKRCRVAGVDVNHADIYNWTGLMVAACAGHKDIVLWLLEEGADASLRNSQQTTALSLAKKRSIARLLTRHLGGQSSEPRKAEAEVVAADAFFCDTCKQEFSDATPEAHQTSLIHLFNCQEKPQATHYYIPPANKGFQLMVRSGWEPERGLGVEGQGRKYPIKTVLKRDRHGLGGSVPEPAKVTHFSPNDADAVAVPVKARTMKASTLSKKHREKKLSKEQAKARDFRLEFYSQ